MTIINLYNKEYNMQDLSIHLLKTGNKNYKELYLDWINNFVSPFGFAVYYRLDEDVAIELINNAIYLYKE